MKKIAIIGSVGIPANYGGYETMVEYMVSHKQSSDIEYTVYCSSKAYTTRLKEYKGAKLIYIPFDANGWQAMIYDALSIIHAYFHSDGILALGSSGSFVFPFLRLFGKKVIVSNYDGVEVNRQKWSWGTQKLIFLLQWLAARFSTYHIADNEAIVEILKDMYHIDSVVIEYGGDQVFRNDDYVTLEEKYNLKNREYYFNVARIEPENNIHLMLECFSHIPNETLVVVGNWSKNEYGRGLYEKYSKLPNIRLMQPVYEQNDINLLRSCCKLYIHPHSKGGTNPSLVEAMFLGCPIVAFDVIFNRKTTENKALYFGDSEELKTIISGLTDMELKDNACDMKEIADRRYRWKVISEKYESLFLANK